MRRAKSALYDVRKQRVWPGRDDKILASWNGLMVPGIAEAARAFADEKYRDVAIDSATFLFENLVNGGRVLRSFKDGRARIADIQDHASLGLAARAINELTFDRSWLDKARQLGDSVVRWFWGRRDRRVLRHSVRSRATHRAAARGQRQCDAIGYVAASRSSCYPSRRVVRRRR